MPQWDDLQKRWTSRGEDALIEMNRRQQYGGGGGGGGVSLWPLIKFGFIFFLVMGLYSKACGTSTSHRNGGAAAPVVAPPTTEAENKVDAGPAPEKPKKKKRKRAKAPISDTKTTEPADSAPVE